MPTPQARSGGAGLTILWVVLLLSLIGNAFFIGGLIRFHTRPFGDAPAAGDLMGPRQVWQDLSPDSRRYAMRELRARRGEMRQYFADLAVSRKEVLDALRAEPFDAAAYRAALDHGAEIDAAARGRANEFFVTIFSHMSPAERRALADEFEERLARWERSGARRPPWMRDDGPPGAPPPPQGGSEGGPTP